MLKGIRAQIAELHQMNADVLKNYESLEVFSDAKSTYEIERAEREAVFDARIERIKDELAKEQAQRQSNNVAEELHPLVKNIPHNEVRDTQREPDIEYAE